jgi:hypothetical protein
VRSANRRRWIDEFRDLIARFCAEIATSAQVREKIVRDGRIVIQAEAEFLSSFEKLIYTTNKIRPMVNPLEHEHQKLIDLMNGLLVRFQTASAEYDLQSEGQEIVRQIVTMSVEIIRREWLRAKTGV